MFGGLHGDVPIEPTGGKLIADLIIDRALSAVVDVSQFETDTDKAHFAQDFAARFFFRKKAAPSPVMLFLEECQEFIPEDPQKNETKMQHHFTRMVKLGRNFGIGIGMVTQRPQEVSKKCLNLTECMFAFQMTGPHERKTVETWVKEKGVDLDIVAKLPTLHIGECHIWSPRWLRISQTVKISKKWTFNSSSTPEHGVKRIEPKPLDDAAMEKLRKEMAATIERSEAENPKKLQAKVAELQKQLAAKQAPAPAAAPVVKEVPAERLKKEFDKGALAERKRIHAGIGMTLNNLRKELGNVLPLSVEIIYPGDPYSVQVGAEALKHLDCAIDMLRKDWPLPVAVTEPIPSRQPAAVSPPAPVPKRVASSNGAGTALDRALKPIEQKILNILAQYPAGRTQEQVAHIAGSRLHGGFFKALADLRKTALIAGPGSCLQVTDAGKELAVFEELPTGEALLKFWKPRLPLVQANIIDALYKAHPDAVSQEDLAQAIGSKLHGGFFKGLADLRKLELINGPGSANRISPLFFES